MRFAHTYRNLNKITAPNLGEQAVKTLFPDLAPWTQSFACLAKGERVLAVLPFAMTVR